MRPSYHFTAASFNDGYTVNCTAGHGTFKRPLFTLQHSLTFLSTHNNVPSQPSVKVPIIRVMCLLAILPYTF